MGGSYYPFYNASGVSSVVSLDLGSSWAANSLDSARYFTHLENKARFQQKQQQEKEHKLLALYADQARKAYARINAGGGKVRQLFQERRGFDKSYPLQPLQSRRRGTSLDRAQAQRHQDNNNPCPCPCPLPRRNNSHIGANTVITRPTRYPSAGEENYYYDANPPFYAPFHKSDDEYYLAAKAKSGREVDESEHDSILDSAKVFKKLPNIGGTTLAEQRVAMAPVPTKEQPLKKADSATIRSMTKSMSKLTPPTRKTEVKQIQNCESRRKVGVGRPTANPVGVNSNKELVSSTRARPRPSSSSSTTETRKARGEPRMEQSMKPVSSKQMAGGGGGGGGGKMPGLTSSSVVNADLVLCKICNRSFARDRIEAHQNICAKTSRKKRKPFDPVKQRLTGTGAEKYLKKGKPQSPPTNLKKNNWRKKHEEFISNIRAAKMAQAHVAAGGKLSDLPPPPPLDTSDYVQCPHCGRKFNEAAANRHIPICVNMMHNKPKPNKKK